MQSLFQKIYKEMRFSTENYFLYSIFIIFRYLHLSLKPYFKVARPLSYKTSRLYTAKILWVCCWKKKQGKATYYILRQFVQVDERKSS